MIYRLLVVAFMGMTTAAYAAKSISVGTLTLTHCNGQYDGYCGSIQVPLDRQNSQSGQITVGFEFYPHTDTSVAPSGVILAQEGGPGYSTTGSRDGYVRLLTPLRDHRDILLVDKRGTGTSSAIDCPALQKAYNPKQADVAACATQLGSNAWYYRSADAAEDVVAVVNALQLGPVDYYGDSYATWFGEVLAVLHPQFLRSMVLDSAYPVLHDNFNSEENHGQRAMDLVCQRSPACKALGSSATARFAQLLTSLRANPVSGTAPGAEGEARQVTADPGGLFLIIANAGNAPTTWRDLDAAGRAWTGSGDSLPLLRMVAEARDSYSGGGPAKQFSVGLEDAVECAEYGNPFSLSDPLPERQSIYKAYLQNLRQDHAATFAPFEINDAIHAQMNAEGYNTCLTWSAPPTDVPEGQPIPPGSVFPNVPVLVLSGELDTVTSPHEGRATAKLFPNSTFLLTRNLVHESAISDAGVFVSPTGQDFAACIGPIVRNFITSGGETGDTSCIADIRPIRTVPVFAAQYQDVPSAVATKGNAADAKSLVLASAVTETVGDVMARYYVTTSGNGAGLRGGSFDLNSTATGYSFDLTNLQWAQNLTVNGTMDWNQ